MKITVQTLRRIIKEEITRTLLEGVANPTLKVDPSEDTSKNTSVFFDEMVRHRDTIKKMPDGPEKFNKLLKEFPELSFSGDKGLSGVREKYGYSHLQALYWDAVKLNKNFGIVVTSYEDIDDVIDENMNTPEMAAAREVVAGRAAQAKMITDFEDKSPW